MTKERLLSTLVAAVEDATWNQLFGSDRNGYHGRSFSDPAERSAYRHYYAFARRAWRKAQRERSPRRTAQLRKDMAARLDRSSQRRAA